MTKQRNTSKIPFQYNNCLIVYRVTIIIIEVSQEQTLVSRQRSQFLIGFIMYICLLL